MWSMMAIKYKISKAQDHGGDYFFSLFLLSLQLQNKQQKYVMSCYEH